MTTIPSLFNLFLSVLFIAMTQSTRVQLLSTEAKKIEKLKLALKSGHPWLIGCLGVKDQDSNVNSMLEGLTNELDQNTKFKDLPDKVNVGKVNCKSKLPSGKSIKSKYKLTHQKNIPTFFFVGNGRQPVQLKINDFTKKDKKDKTKLMLEPKVLARYATLAAVPTVHQIKTDVALKHNCLKHKRGSVLLLLGKNGGRSKKLTKSQKRVLTIAMRKNRGTKFCSVDLSKHELHLPPAIATKVIRDDSKSDNHIEARPPQMLFFGWGPNSTAKIRKRSEEKENELKKKHETKPKKFGQFRHLNERSKQWDSKTKNSKVSMSMCRHLMHDQMERNEGRRIFEEHRISLKHLTKLKTPESKFTHKNALFRIQGRYYTWETAAPFLATMALFDGSLSTDALSRLDAKSMHMEKRKKAEAAAADASQKASGPQKSNNVHHVGVAPLRGGKFNAKTVQKALEDMSTILKDDGVMHELKLGTRPKLSKYVSPLEKARKKKLKEKNKMKALRKKRQKKKQEETSKKKKMDTKKEILEERKKERARKEQAKRMEMDKMAKKHFVQGVEEEEEDTEDSDTAEQEDAVEEDEDVINVDDDDSDSAEELENNDNNEEEVVNLDEVDDDDEDVINLDDDEEEEDMVNLDDDEYDAADDDKEEL